MKPQLGTGAKGSPASPERQTASDAQALRALAEEIFREAAPKLEETALVLYDRDPEYLQAQWYVTSETLAEAHRLFPGNGSGLRRVLRLCRLEQAGRTEIVASISQGSGALESAGENGFALPGDSAEYSCELGLESDAGGWLLLARSNRVRSGSRWQLSPSQAAPARDNPQARNISFAASEQPREIEDMLVEAALAVVGSPLHPAFPNPDLDDTLIPVEHPVPPEETLDRAWDQKLEYLRAGVPSYLVSSGESCDASLGCPAPLAEVPGQETPKQEISDQAGSDDRRSEFSPGIFHDPVPRPEIGAKVPFDASIEGALAAVGESLYPVFPNPDLDDVPIPGYFGPLGEELGQVWLQYRGLEIPSGIPQDSAPYPEMTTDLPPGAELMDMPPPLLPSSPKLDTAPADMPGPIYDPRAALSSAVLSSEAPTPLPDLELHAELIVQGRAAAGSTVNLFGYPIVVGADGRFYIRRPIDISALESLAAGGGLPAWLETAGHG